MLAVVTPEALHGGEAQEFAFGFEVGTVIDVAGVVLRMESFDTCHDPRRTVVLVARTLARRWWDRAEDEIEQHTDVYQENHDRTPHHLPHDAEIFPSEQVDDHSNPQQSERDGDSDP